MTIRLTLFGGFEARLRTGGALSLPARKAQALLVYLAVHPGHAQPRDKLAALLWGESPDAQARDGLRHALAALRQALPATEPPILAIEGHALGLRPAVVEVDVATFERCVAEGTPEALEEAVALYQGDLLSGFILSEPLFEEWLVSERERLRELALEAIAKLLAHQCTTGATERAIQSAVRLLALDPLQEAAHRTLMRLYVRQGRRGAALKQYQRCVTVLQRELGAEPEAETRQLYRDLLRQPPAEVAKPAPTRPRPVPARIDLPGRDKPLFGREADRARLGQVLDEVSRGRGHLIVLVGEAGIGKTSLLGAVAAEAYSKGARVLLGRCYESTQILPFGPWVDACRAGDVLGDEEAVEALDPAWRAELIRLFPEIDATGLPPPSDNDLRLFECVARLVEQLAARRPLVLMLEDVHWADEMSLRFLAFLTRRVPSRHVLLVVSSREEELAEAAVARRTLEELGREPWVTRVTLAPLRRPDTIALIRSLARSASDAGALARLEDQVWAVSEGNPFVAVETMRAFQDGTIPSDSTGLPLAERVRAMIAARLERLSEPARQLAAMASVIGREFEFSLLQRASGLDEAWAAEGVEELVRRRVLREVDEGFDFIHHRLQAVVYDRLLPPRRKLLHRRAGDALEALSSGDPERDPLALGLHFSEAEVWEKAVGYLRAAGADAMARSAYREAAACFDRALAAWQHLSPTPEAVVQAIDLRLDLRVTLHALGESERGVSHLREAERLARALDDQRRLGWVSVYLSHYHWLNGEPTEASRLSQGAIAIGEKLEDFRLLVAAAYYFGLANFALGNYALAAESLRRILRVLGGDRWRERCGLAGFPAVMARANLARILGRRGDLVEGITHAQEGMRIAEPVEHPYTLVMACYGLGLLYEAQGDLRRSADVFERALALAEKWNLVSWLPSLKTPLGQVYVLSGRVQEGIALLRSALRSFESMYRRPTSLSHRAHLVEALMLTGELDEALALAEQALALARESRQRGDEALCRFAIAKIHAGREPLDIKESEEWYRRSLALAGELGMRPLIAHCHLGLCKLYRRTGNAEQAQEHLTTATAMYGEMGMTYWLEQAEVEMRSLA